MNNIEILEEFIEDYKELVTQEKEVIIDYKYLKEKVQAIENLIKENKELKEKAKNTMALIGANYIHKDKVKEKIEILEKCTTKIDKKVNLTDYMIRGKTERAVGRFVNLDFIKKVLLDEPGYNIELLEEGE